ncbi:MAG: hypothetical protein Q4A00_05200 [Flavobacteriaceae bacterium]|nr:hypothetical protein [Flavobacteriaceae bacterium]
MLFTINLNIFAKIYPVKNISLVFYILAGVLVGWYFYQYEDYYLYVGGSALSFVLLNSLVVYLYRGFKQKPMALMRFMGINFLKDFLWAGFWMFLIKDNAALALFLAGIFLLLSIPIYIAVLSEQKK